MSDSKSSAAASLESGETRHNSNEGATPILSDKDTGEESWLGALSMASLGPALVCCLADGDAGSLIVAAQSGTRWHYSLTLVQILLVPILFTILEALVRTGVSEKRGFSAMVREHFGMRPALFSLALLLISCFGAIVSQMSGISSVAALWGCSQAVATTITAFFVVGIVILCDYKQVERVALFFGLFELIFVVVLAKLHPPLTEVLTGMIVFDFSSSSFMRMLAANIGAVVMPWMIYFQQSAVVARRLTTTNEIAQERTQSLLGSILAQLIMVSTMVAMAAIPQEASNLESIRGIQVALQPVFGHMMASVMVSMAFLGGSVCAIFVVSLAAAWAVCDTTGDGAEDPFSLDKKLVEAPRFYASFVVLILFGALVLAACPDVVKLNVFIEVLNAFMVPMSLMFLYLVVTGPSMDPKLRITGTHRLVILSLFCLTSAVAVISTIASFVGGSVSLEEYFAYM